MIRVHVDPEKCQGHNRCYAIAPELFDVDELGNAHELNGGEVPAALAEWWTRFQDESTEGRAAMLKPDEAPKKKRRPRGRGRKRAAAEAATEKTTHTDESSPD